MENEKSKGQLLQDELLINNKNGWDLISDDEAARADAFCEEYKAFLNACKTERETVDYTVEMLEKAGYTPFDRNQNYSAGDKVYINNRGKALLFATIGTQPIEKGVRIMASHIDSPKLDLKPRPLYEEAQLALFKTHYYGGIKRYQWGTIPLALHGVVVKRDGTMVKVNIGEAESDPVFCITDLLPHLGKEQMARTLQDGLKGEELNVLVGSRMFKDDKASERVKLYIISLLKEKYDISEPDFLSAELMLVPAFQTKDLGFDRSMIGGYGHDDRICAYTSLRAAMDVTSPAYTTVTVLADKEETGSDGNTGMQSRVLEYFIADLAEQQGIPGRVVLSNSKCLSADVAAAYDPTFSDVSEKRNSAYLNYGVAVMKYTGSGGKYSTNEATAEFMAYVRNILDEKNVLWQTCELGKVDAGGGGTVAKYISKLNVDVVDIGVAVLSMHSPFEVVSKLDTYMTYRAFYEFAAAK